MQYNKSLYHIYIIFFSISFKCQKWKSISEFFYNTDQLDYNLEDETTQYKHTNHILDSGLMIYSLENSSGNC